MKEKLQQLYPGTIIQNQPLFDKNYQCFLDEQTNEYIAIPKKQLTEKEMMLLKIFYSPVKQTATFLNNSVEQKKWHNYFFENGLLPKIDERLRFIHFHLNSQVDIQQVYDSIYSFFQEDIVLIWIDEQNGVILERETDGALQQKDFLSFQDTILTDFYLDTDLYIGRYFAANSRLKNHFFREQYYFQIIRKAVPQQRFYTFNTAFPAVILRTEWNKMNKIFAEEFHEIFQNDKDLLNMIKVFLENNSNTSLAAKKLYMHRNSLQYRIDKFIKHTSIDIRDFNGAIAVYFVCIYGEYKVRNRDGSNLAK